MTNDSFREFCDKRFVQDQKVIVHSLGPSMEGEFLAIVRGVYAYPPCEMYIIEWLHPDEMKRFYGKDFWTHCVMAKGCLRDVD